MKELFKKNFIEISNENFEKFDKYYSLISEYNQKFNLTAIKEREEVYLKNFIDSILFMEEFDCGKLLDVGSGGGFPAIPLKIINDKLDMVLLEATGKKCEFLKVVIKELNLTNIKVINARAEEIAFNPSFREQFDYCTSRAVASLNQLCEYCLPFVKVGGKMMAFKGSKVYQELEEAKNAIDLLGASLEKVVEKNLQDNFRSLVILKKQAKILQKYPRLNGKIKKNPL